MVINYSDRHRLADTDYKQAENAIESACHRPTTYAKNLLYIIQQRYICKLLIVVLTTTTLIHWCVVGLSLVTLPTVNNLLLCTAVCYCVMH